MREIPRKNYFILFIVILSTFIVTIILSNIYRERFQNKYKSPIEDVLTVITVKDFDNYIIENPNIAIYVGNSKDETLETYESNLGKQIIEYNLQNSFVYLDYSKMSKSFKSKIASTYNVNLDNYTTPFIIIISNNLKIYNIKDYSIGQLINILDVNEVLD